MRDRVRFLFRRLGANLPGSLLQDDVDGRDEPGHDGRDRPLSEGEGADAYSSVPSTRNVFPTAARKRIGISFW